MVASFEETWAGAKRYRIEQFKPFALVGENRTTLWAPAYIRDRWRILELDLDVAKQGASNVFVLANDAGNIVSFVKAAIARRTPREGTWPLKGAAGL